MNKTKLFPKNFLWGASTASHQVEGGNHNQWTEWELANASELARTAKNRLSWTPRWDDVAARAKDPANYVSGRAVDHLNRYKEDFQIASKSLNLNSFRFGIEWSRVQPTEDSFDNSAWQHYRDYIREMKKSGLEPMLNIWHWTMPTWFTKKGGFLHASNIVYFENFVSRLCQELDIKELKYVITLNEPNVYSSFGYVAGEWPPNRKSWFEFIRVYRNLWKAHIRVYKILKAHNPKLKIGVAAQLANIQAKRPHNLFDQISTKWMRFFWNWLFLNQIHKYQDFVGFNYYFTDYYRHGKRDNPKLPLSDLGWYMEPEGLYPLILRVWAHYKKPIIVTENGVADEKDNFRQWWLTESMLAIERALSEGAEVVGYFHWSLLDNFEWAYGWWPKFGLVEVDQKTQKRTIRPSSLWWAEKLKDIQNR
jgi:beta-glucosidase